MIFSTINLADRYISRQKKTYSKDNWVFTSITCFSIYQKSSEIRPYDIDELLNLAAYTFTVD